MNEEIIKIDGIINKKREVLDKLVRIQETIISLYSQRESAKNLGIDVDASIEALYIKALTLDLK